MAGKKLTKVLDPETEDLFDYMKEYAHERMADDLFIDEPESVLCEVLKVFEVARNTKHYDWVDSILPGRGRKTKIVCFKGRILSRTGTVTAHSNLPNPRWMPGSVGGGKNATKQAHWWIDLHPTFVGRSKDAKVPNVGDVVTVEFVKGYASAAGEWCGIFKDFYAASIGPNGLISEKIDPKKPFGPDARLKKPETPAKAPKVPFDMPKRILLVGDEMFGVNSTRVGTDTTFAGTVKSYISRFYDLIHENNIKKIQKDFDIPKKHATELVDRYVGAILEKPAGDVTAPTSLDRHFEVEFFNISTAYVDATFYSLEGKEIYSSSAATTRANKLADTTGISTARAKALVGSPSPQVTYKQPWKTGSEAKKKIKSDSGADVLKEVLKSKNSRGQPFDFAIIAGPVGQSTIPGWGGDLPNAPKDWQMLYNALLAADTGASTRRDWEFRSYTRQIAKHQSAQFKDFKKKHFKQVLQGIFGGGNIKGAIWIGPPLMVGRGRTSWFNSSGKESFEFVTAETAASERGGNRFRDVDDKKQVVAFRRLGRYRGEYARAPWYDKDYDIRLQSSLAIKETIEEEGKGKVYPCLAYCSKDFGFDASLKSQAIANYKEHGSGHLGKLLAFNVKARINNKIVARKNRDAYARWVVRNLALYILGIPADSIAIDPKAATPKTTEDVINRKLGGFEEDRAFINKLWREIMPKIQRDEGDPEIEKAIGKIAGQISDQYLKTTKQKGLD